MLGSGLVIRPDRLHRAGLLNLALSSGMSDALVSLELSGWQSGLEHLGDLLKSTVFDLRHVEVNEHCCDKAGREPDVSVLWTPVEGCWVDKVWGGEAMVLVSTNVYS